MQQFLVQGGMFKEYSSRQGAHQAWTDGNLHILQLPYDRLILIALNACQRSNNCEYVIMLLIFSYGLLGRVMVFLVREEYVVEEGALAWEESASNF